MGTRGYEVGTRGDVGWGRIGTLGLGGALQVWGDHEEAGLRGNGDMGPRGGDEWGWGDVGRGHTGTQGRAVPPHSFNQLDLPAYESYEKLRQMLLLAIQECSEGFGLA